MKRNFLHLSDIHFCNSNFNTSRMRDLLIKKIGELAVIDPISYILITGDLTYQNAPYGEPLLLFLENLLRKCGLSHDRILIVPGNHDVARSTLRTTILKTIQADEDFNDFPYDVEKQLLADQNSFFAFHDKIVNVTFPQDLIHWSFAGEGFNIILINTAITSGRDDEEGHLKINLQKLYNALHAKDGKNVINIAMGHHGLDCMYKKDKEKTISLFEDHDVNMYLCGHIHKSGYAINADGFREIPQIVAGAGIVDGYGEPGFNIVTIDDSDMKAKVTFYIWNNEKDIWVVNTGVGRKAVNGVLELTLANSNAESNCDYVVDEDDFRRFIAEFHKNVQAPPENASTLYMKDVSEKFTNMKCSSTVSRQYEKLSVYFPVVDQVMESPLFMPAECKLIIVGVVISEYNNAFDLYSTGNQILEAVVSGIFKKYQEKLRYPEPRLKHYIKILVFWLIYGCDIFDDIKE